MIDEDKKRLKSKPIKKNPIGTSDYLFLSRYLIDDSGRIRKRKHVVGNRS